MKQENIAIYLPMLQRFDSAFFKPYQIWMFTQAWRYIIHLRYFTLWIQKTSLCYTSSLYLKKNTIFCHRQKKSHYFWTGVYNRNYNVIKQVCGISPWPLKNTRPTHALFRIGIIHILWPNSKVGSHWSGDHIKHSVQNSCFLYSKWIYFK